MVNITKGRAGLMSSEDKTKLDKYPELTGDSTQYLNGEGEFADLDDAINDMLNDERLEIVTAIKGGAEETYRSGLVNITAADIGLDSVDNTHDSVKSVAYAASAGAADNATYAANATNATNATNAAAADNATYAANAGSAAGADKLNTARTITLKGAITGSTTFDGSGNVTIDTNNATITGAVTGVKGSSESTYRTGNVNVTAANIGLGNVDNTHDNAKTVAAAAKLSTSRRISIGGAVTGSTIFDGSGDVTIIAAADNFTDATAIHNGDSGARLEDVTITRALVGVNDGELWGLKVDRGLVTLVADIVKSERATLENVLIGTDDDDDFCGLKVNRWHVTLGADVVKSEWATLGDNVKIGDSATLGDEASIGYGATLQSPVIIDPDIRGLDISSGGGGVTGVKGGAESSYRTGDVNITAANIGLGNVDNTHDNAKTVAAATKATQDGSGDIIANTYAKLSGATFTGAVNASGGLILPTTASTTNGAIWLA